MMSLVNENNPSIWSLCLDEKVAGLGAPYLLCDFNRPDYSLNRAFISDVFVAKVSILIWIEPSYYALNSF